jgi:hypothetical protein
MLSRTDSVSEPKQALAQSSRGPDRHYFAVKEVVVTGRACIWLAAGFAATWTVSPLASVQHRLDWPGAVPLTQVGDSDGTNHELLVRLPSLGRRRRVDLSRLRCSEARWRSSTYL